MGIWSGEPFGNDSAGDWGYMLDDLSDWALVEKTLGVAAERQVGDLDEELASCAIAAAEVVAHGLGRPTEVDSYTESAVAFVARAGAPDARLVPLAVSAIAAATSDRSDLTKNWTDWAISSQPTEWWEANEKLVKALRG